MMTNIEQETLDIDWFFTDNISIAFVASAGGKLPVSVAKSKINIEKLTNYFRSLPIISDVEINDHLLKTFKNEEMRQKYFADFILMAKKGLYAFDKITLNDFSDSKYQLVVKPKRLLNISDIPNDILSILNQTKFEQNLNNANIIDVMNIN